MSKESRKAIRKAMKKSQKGAIAPKAKPQLKKVRTEDGLTVKEDYRGRYII